MIPRILWFCTFGVAVNIVPAMAQENSLPTGPLDSSRYTIENRDDGFVRLDRQNGNMSFCSVNSGNMICRLGADERLAYEDEIAKLHQRLDGIEERISSIGEGQKQTKPSLSLPENRPKVDVPGTKPKETELDKEFEKAMEFAQDAMRRFFEVVKDLKQKYEGDKG